MNEHMEQKRSAGLRWMKGESGNSYLCPIDALRGIANPTEADLERLCVNESHNPQND